MIFTDDEGVYRAEYSDVPVLKKAVITSEVDEDEEYGVEVDGEPASYAHQDRVFPLETILIGGNPFFVGQRAVTAEELFGHASDSDGGVNLNMSFGPIPERHYEWRDCECKRICDKKEDPDVGPNEDSFYPGGKIYADTITINGNVDHVSSGRAEDPEAITFTLEQVVALLNAFKSEV